MDTLSKSYIKYVQDVLESIIYTECIEEVRSADYDSRVSKNDLEMLFQTAVIDTNEDGSFYIHFNGSPFLVKIAEDIFYKIYNVSGKERIKQYVDNNIVNRIKRYVAV